jgi:hyaluronoglucosaminidase
VKHSYGLISIVFALAACTPSGPATLQFAPNVLLYPAPLHATQEPRALHVATACVSTGQLAQHDTLDARVPDIVHGAGLMLVAPGPDCDYTLAFSSVLPSLTSDEQDAWAATSSFAGADERYVVVAVARDMPAVASAELYAESERGALHALTTAMSLVDDQQRLHGARVVDAPAIATRGIVEGYYGTPLDRGQRNCVITTMERLRQNLYLYGPKDDLYARVRWADPYPPDLAADMSAAAAAARARLVDFVWSISPGQNGSSSQGSGSITFSSASDFKRLTDKIDSMRALGVDRFALFLDDTSPTLFYEADRAVYPSPVAAHVDLANRLDAYVTGGNATAPHIIFVGLAYTTQNPDWKAYATTLGQALNPSIPVLWTGPYTYSRSMQASDMVAPDRALGRKVTIWDNEPEDPKPLTGHSADLPAGISGFLSNPIVIESGYSFDDWWRTLGSVADYTWGPAGYDATRSFNVWFDIGAKPPGC